MAENKYNILSVLFRQSPVLEMRIPKANKYGQTYSGYFDNEALMIDCVKKYDGKVPGIYVSLNPINPALLARTKNRVEENIKLTTNDDDILRRVWILGDIDPIRPAGISSTNEEHEAAISKAFYIKEYLNKKGWANPIIADSGNGASLLYRIDLPNSSESTELLKNCLKSFDFIFTDEKIEIDTSVFNAARIVKLYGTVAKKGDNTPERPHRESKILELPEELKVIEPNLIRDFVATIPKEPEEPRDKNRSQSGFDIEQWMKQYNISVAKQKTWKGGTIYNLEVCPFDSNHTYPDACIIKAKSGALGFHCFHNSCSSHDWKALREKLEPDKKKGKEKKGEEKLTVSPYFEGNRFLAKVLGDEILSVHRFISMDDNPTEMYFYKGGVYIPNAENIIAQFAQATLGERSSKHCVNETIFYIQTASLASRQKVNAEKRLINLKNGVYNLDTKQLEPHSPDLFFTVQIPVEYNPEAKCDNIALFLCETLRKEDITLVLQAAGYLLISDYSIQKALMFAGSGGNGKGTLSRVLIAFLGRENVSNESLQTLNMDRFSSANLFGKLANIFSDLPDSAIYDDYMFKSLTGGDRIPAERKFQNRFYFDNKARLIFSANTLPRHPKAGYAWNRRWAIIDFPRTFEGRLDDKELDAKLQTAEELSGLLNLALWSLQWLLETKELYYSKTPDEVGEEYLLKSDSLAAFLKEYTVPTDDDILKTTLYNVYLEWTRIIKIKSVLPANILGKSMKHKGYTVTRPYSDGERQPPCWEGIQLNLDALDKLRRNRQGLGKVEESNPDCTQNQDAYIHWFNIKMVDGQGRQGSLYNFLSLLIAHEREKSIDSRNNVKSIELRCNPAYPAQSQMNTKSNQPTDSESLQAGIEKRNPAQKIDTVTDNSGNCDLCSQHLDGSECEPGKSGQGMIHTSCKKKAVIKEKIAEILSWYPNSEPTDYDLLADTLRNETWKQGVTISMEEARISVITAFRERGDAR